MKLRLVCLSLFGIADASLRLRSYNDTLASIKIDTQVGVAPTQIAPSQGVSVSNQSTANIVTVTSTSTATPDQPTPTTIQSTDTVLLQSSSLSLSQTASVTSLPLDDTITTTMIVLGEPSVSGRSTITTVVAVTAGGRVQSLTSRIVTDVPTGSARLQSAASTLQSMSLPLISFQASMVLLASLASVWVAR